LNKTTAQANDLNKIIIFGISTIFAVPSALEEEKIPYKTKA